MNVANQAFGYGIPDPVLVVTTVAMAPKPKAIAECARAARQPRRIRHAPRVPCTNLTAPHHCHRPIVKAIEKAFSDKDQPAWMAFFTEKPDIFLYDGSTGALVRSVKLFNGPTCGAICAVLWYTWCGP